MPLSLCLPFHFCGELLSGELKPGEFLSGEYSEFKPGEPLSSELFCPVSLHQ